MLVVELKIESQSVVVLVHVEEGAHHTGQECSLLTAGMFTPLSSGNLIVLTLRSSICDSSLTQDFCWAWYQCLVFKVPRPGL